MHKFKVTTWPDSTSYTVEVSSGDSSDLHYLSPEEATELLECLNSALSGGKCEHTLAHRLEGDGGLFVFMLAVSDRHVRAYTVSKRKLVELKVELMGALNG